MKGNKTISIGELTWYPHHDGEQDIIYTPTPPSDDEFIYS